MSVELNKLLNLYCNTEYFGENMTKTKQCYKLH